MGLIINGSIEYSDIMASGYSSPIYLTNPDEIKTNPDSYQNVFTYPASRVAGNGAIFCITYISEVSGTQRLSVLYFSRQPFSFDRYNRGVYNNTFTATLQEDADIGDYYFYSNIYLDPVSFYDTIPTSLNYYTDSNNFSSTLVAKYVLTGIYDSNTDPYGPGGNTGVGGGTGTFSGTGDDIGIPALPTLSATATGFITLFNPTTVQMASLAAYMWTGAFDLDTFKKIFAYPMECMLGLSIVPVAVPAGSSAEVKVGNIGTGIFMTTAASQYVEVDCGTLNVEEFWGAYLDYDPFTKAEIYLPYIGTHPIAVDDIMGKSVHVVYHVDILSGACIAYVQCGGSVLYSFIGQCSSSIPITGQDWTNVINGVLSIAGSIGSMVATGGATLPAAVETIISTAVNQNKPSVEKSGSLSGTGGMMGIQVPYLILTRPRQALPLNQNAYTGYPSFITSNLGSLNGYTEVEEIHLENVPATSGELAEIVSLLKGGVIF